MCGSHISSEQLWERTSRPSFCRHWRCHVYCHAFSPVRGCQGMESALTGAPGAVRTSTALSSVPPCSAAALTSSVSLRREDMGAQPLQWRSSLISHSTAAHHRYFGAVPVFCFKSSFLQTVLDGPEITFIASRRPSSEDVLSCFEYILTPWDSIHSHRWDTGIESHSRDIPPITAMPGRLHVNHPRRRWVSCSHRSSGEETPQHSRVTHPFQCWLPFSAVLMFVSQGNALC